MDKHKQTPNSMTRPQKLRSEKFQNNITKRGKVPIPKKEQPFTVGPIVLGFFVFVVVGSAILQIFRGG